MGRESALVAGVVAVFVATTAAASATVVAGNASGDVTALVQPFGDYNRPVVGIVDRAGPGPAFRRTLVADRGAGELSLAVGSGGEALAAWRQGKFVWAATAAPGRGFDEPRRLGTGNFNMSVSVAVNGRGVGVVAWPHREAMRLVIHSALGGFAAPRDLNGIGPAARLVGLDDSDTALFVEPGLPGQSPTAWLGPVDDPPGAPQSLGPSGPAALTFEGAAIDPGGRAAVALGQGNDLLVAVRAPGKAFGAPVRVPGATSAGFRHLATSASGETLVLWRPSTPSGRSLPPIDAASVDALGNVAGPFRVGEQITEPQRFVADASGNAVLAWRQGDRIFASYRRASATFTPAVALDAPRPGLIVGTRNQRAPDVIMRSGDAAIVAWERSNGAAITQVLRPLDASGAGPRQVLDRQPAFRRVASPRACLPSGARPLLRTGKVLISSVGDDLLDGATLYGCLLARGVPESLGGGDEFFFFPPPAIAVVGPYVAYGNISCTVADDCNSYVEVTDLRDPHYGRNRSAPAYDEFSLDGVGGVVVKANTSFAWIGCSTSELRRCRRSDTSRVFKLEASSDRPVVLEDGTGIDPNSLTLRGSRLRWTRKGQTRRATLR